MSSRPTSPQGTLPHHTDDALLVKQYVLQALVLDVLERDIAGLASSSLKMAYIYIESLRQAQDEATAELYRIRKQFRQRGIKVYDEERQTHGIRVHYMCRGYEHSFYMLRGLLRTEVTSLVKRYLHIHSAEQPNTIAP
ncbi:hypothetical protein [Paenibacillus taiwanensis]|uniref:hypothetical protein n=1 Tax=Paenibacillus taiwanensis TaxID=401638 RepID=UPI00041CFA20|nr:hypothetical protein [Paenibacillus taiwanensis]